VTPGSRVATKRSDLDHRDSRDFLISAGGVGFGSIVSGRGPSAMDQPNDRRLPRIRGVTKGEVQLRDQEPAQRPQRSQRQRELVEHAEHDRSNARKARVDPTFADLVGVRL